MIEKHQKVDSTYLILTIIMLGIGIVVQYSASSFLAAAKYNNPNVYIIAHLKRLMVGVIIGIGFMFFNYKWLKKIAFWLTIVSMMFLVAVVVYYKAKGIPEAARWLSIGPFRFQPSEFTKLALIIYIASFIDRH
ncbi:MAG: FtsW/RodA/SpoVE family cell cycle protein, partial [Candidatus Marinimicrobia bacterium]|nr:FtsW/RodA/SpoVE family cell cycle protein [Candidatus Neomarinimicrobiota bacterium]